MLRQTAAFCALLCICGCQVEIAPLISETFPLNGSTDLEPAVSPEILFSSSISLDPADRKVVLYDVTRGARLTVLANIEMLGSRLIYRPTSPLPGDHDFELEVKQEAISAGDADQLDASEWPQEQILWPYRLRFSTRSRPRVRAAYLDRRDGGFRILLHFSQPMDVVTTSAAIRLQTLDKTLLQTREPVWSSDQTLRIDLLQPLDAATPYSLLVDQEAQSRDKVPLDGNDDGTPGGEADSFSASFTGSQTVIFSRLPQ